MEDLVRFSDDVECVRHAGKDYSSGEVGVDAEIAQGQVAVSSGPWTGHNGVSTDAERLCLCGAREETVDLLSEVLSSTQWDSSVETVSRDLPSLSDNNSDWATFSPVALSTSYTSVGTSTSWAPQTTAAQSSCGETPFIISGNEPEAPPSGGGGDTGSPGWLAFSLGEDRHTVASSSPWLHTVSQSASDIASSVYPNSSTYPVSGIEGSYEPRPNYPPSVSYSISPHSQPAVFHQCFTGSRTTSDRSKGEDSECDPPVIAGCVGDWQSLRNNSFAQLLWTWSQTSLHHSPPSSCQARLTHLVSRDTTANQVECSQQSVPPSRVVPLGDDEKFDWSDVRRRRAVSPDVVPNLFRPRKESLVDVDFDHDRAASGLAVLSEVELQGMCDEMTGKFSRLSEELLTSLKTRDVLAGEMEAKNRFVSALLRVQQLRHSQDQNGVSGEAGRGRQWVWSQKRRDEETPGMYLQTIIPYKIPDGLKWRTDTLIQLTKVLKAIAEGSSSVPKLMSEYLQTEFIASPIDSHLLEDSISSDQTTLSNLSL